MTGSRIKFDKDGFIDLRGTKKITYKPHLRDGDVLNIPNLVKSTKKKKTENVSLKTKLKIREWDLCYDSVTNLDD